jgi:hypothetical protein
MLRRIQIQPDDVLELPGKALVVGHLEGLHQMGLQTTRLPDASHARVANARRRSHRARAPVRRVGRRLARGLGDDLAHLRLRDAGLSSRPRRIALDARRPGLQKAQAPARRRTPPYLELGGDLQILHPLRSEQDHSRSLRHANFDATAPGSTLELPFLFFTKSDRRCDSHICSPLMLQTRTSYISSTIDDALH